MSWIKLDDQFADHPKIAVAGPLAAWLHVKALVYCGRYLTDGKIPGVIVAGLVDWTSDGVLVETSNYSADRPDNTALAERLCAAGLWHSVEGGYEIHDYLEWNPSRAQVLAERERQKASKVKAGQAGAAKRWQRDSRPDGSAMAGPMADGWQNDGPVPVPVPVGISKTDHTFQSRENLSGDLSATPTSRPGASRSVEGES